MAKRLNVQLVVIDPQNDFLDIPGAALSVTGANADMNRLAAFIDRAGSKLADIHVTLDSHRLVDIAHPAWWVNQDGDQPNPFTLISASDIAAGIWTTRDPGVRSRTLAYARALEATPGQYRICVWPPHCLIGTWGHNVHAGLNASLQKWSNDAYAMVNYVTKGSNPYTEHYGALMAEVPDPNDPGTGLNTQFLQMLAAADIVAVAGEASSHCVLKTVAQIAENIGTEHIKKFYLLRDCMSPVGALPGVDFPAIADAFLLKMQAAGMTVTTSTDFLS
jgi:nicotinamidase-related amidase